MKTTDSLELAARLARRAGHFAHLHVRTLSALLAVLLGGFGAAAFGIATNGPDAADLPRRLVTETVTPVDIDTQLEALADHSLQLYRSELTRGSDTVDSLLKRLGVADPQAAQFLRTDPTARRLLEGRAGKMVRAITRADGTLDQLVARYAPPDAAQLATHFVRLRVQRSEAGFQAVAQTLPLTSQVRLASGVIRSSLFAATDEARVPDGVATQLAEVFSTDVDFHRELRKGDSFSVLYEALSADGEPIAWGNASGRVLAAEFVNNGHAHSAIWYPDGNGKGNYFDAQGRSKKRAFLASPLEFSRVTSGFAMRLHPISHQWRQHAGVDYGAPTGTPVRAVGDGTVEFAGHQRGYGNVVELRHGNDRSTVYAHLSRIDVRVGQHVEEGARIGAVGATGWATGPHLHFEFKVGGVHHDPLAIAQASETLTLTPAARPRFAALAASMQSQLVTAATLGGATNTD